MKTKIHQLWRLVIAAILVFALAALSAPQVLALETETILYTIPAVFAYAQSLTDHSARVSDAEVTCDGSDPTCTPDVTTRSIHVSKGTASAFAIAALNVFGANASGGGGSYGASAQAFAPFVVHDPQARDQVKVDVRYLKAYASSAFSGAAGFADSASWSVRVYPANGPWQLVLRLDKPGDLIFNCCSNEFPYDTFLGLYTYQAQGFGASTDHNSYFNKFVSKFGEVVDSEPGEGSSVKLDVDLDTIGVIPGLPYLMEVGAGASGNGVAVADPVLTPNAENPDITIEFPNTAADPNPQPLMAGITPEALQATGIDPQPFINLGFFDPPTPSNHPPVARCQNVTVPAAAGACTAVSASINNGSSDPDGTPPTLTQSPAGPYPVGTTAVTLTASDGSLSSQCTATVTVTDGQTPVITCPTDQSATATSSNGAAVTFAPTATDNCGTVMTSCSPASGATFPLGSTPVTCTVTNGAGGQNSCSFNVTVNGSTSYAFTGFFQPVDNVPTSNTVKAGQAIPVKFSLGGNYGLNPLAAGSPTSQQITCPSGGSVDDIEQVITTSNSGLQYDATAATYTYVWKTQQAWANTCQQFNLTLSDGTSHTANFQFK